MFIDWFLSVASAFYGLTGLLVDIFTVLILAAIFITIIIFVWGKAINSISEENPAAKPQKNLTEKIQDYYLAAIIIAFVLGFAYFSDWSLILSWLSSWLNTGWLLIVIAFFVAVVGLAIFILLAKDDTDAPFRHFFVDFVNTFIFVRRTRRALKLYEELGYSHGYNALMEIYEHVKIKKHTEHERVCLEYLGGLEYNSRHYDAAIVFFEQALEKSEEDYMVKIGLHNLLAVIYIDTCQPEQFLKHINAINTYADKLRQLPAEQDALDNIQTILDALDARYKESKSNPL